MEYTTPVTCVVTNVMGHVQDNRPAMKSVTTLRDTLRSMGYLVNETTAVYKSRGFTGVVLIEFGVTDEQKVSAVKLQEKFEEQERGWLDWDASAGLTGCFGWLANRDDARHFRHPNFQDYEYIPLHLVTQGKNQAEKDKRDVVYAIEQYFENLYN